ncbi:Dienelactone hydrolase [Trema orientale]|uniref:Dienelactone hydrolase n=1 Tax=Trema orientale TaxID=63057 RepID=A0A2P5E7F5_TREOI|nr:Dienelactone hydrolase [Trema orientale]
MAGAGCVELLGGLNTYVSGSPTSIFAILFVSTIYGYDAPNIRLVADKFAAAGFYVAVPDFFYGDPFVSEDINGPEQVWIKKHEEDKGVEDAKSVIEALKSKGFAAIGAAGFCWGGKVVAGLAKSKAYIEVAELLHPTRVTLDDIKEVNVPIEILGAEYDDLAPPALLKQYQEILAARAHEVDSYVEIFPNVAHGWTLRYNLDDEAAVNSANEAHKKMLEWFFKYLK